MKKILKIGKVAIYNEDEAVAFADSFQVSEGGSIFKMLLIDGEPIEFDRFKNNKRYNLISYDVDEDGIYLHYAWDYDEEFQLLEDEILQAIGERKEEEQC